MEKSCRKQWRQKRDPGAVVWRSLPGVLHSTSTQHPIRAPWYVCLPLYHLHSALSDTCACAADLMPISLSASSSPASCLSASSAQPASLLDMRTEKSILVFSLCTILPNPSSQHTLKPARLSSLFWPPCPHLTLILSPSTAFRDPNTWPGGPSAYNGTLKVESNSTINGYRFWESLVNARGGTRFATQVENGPLYYLF